MVAAIVVFVVVVLIVVIASSSRPSKSTPLPRRGGPIGGDEPDEEDIVA